MPDIVISDASTLIVLQNIDELVLLRKVYTTLITTPEIAEEFGDPLPDWIRIQMVSDKKYQALLETQLDKGEASAIALASELQDVLLLLDDLKARKLAITLNLKISGTLGVIHKAKQLNIITEVKPLIEKLVNANFRISGNVVKEILRLNNE